MNPRPVRVPVGVIELLRLFVVVFFAGLGYQVAVAADPVSLQLGPLDAVDHQLTFGPGPKTIVKVPPVGPIRLRFRLRKAKLFGWSLA